MKRHLFAVVMLSMAMATTPRLRAPTFVPGPCRTSLCTPAAISSLMCRE